MVINQKSQASKFSQIWQLYCEQTNTHTEYIETSLNFILELLTQIITNLDWPEEQITYVLSRKPLKTESYSAQKDKLRAILIPSYQGILRFDLGLNLWEKQTVNESNFEPILFIVPISVRLINLGSKPYRFIVKITDRDPSSFCPSKFEISQENKSEGFEQVSNFIHERIKGKIVDGINWSIEEQKVQREKPFSITLD